MTSFQKRTVSVIFQDFGNGIFTAFDAASALQTTLGNIQPTIRDLIRKGVLIEVEGGFYRINVR